MSSELESNSFATSLADMEFGALIPRLSEELCTIVRAVRQTGRAGGLALGITIKPTGVGQVEVITKVTPKHPAPDAGKSIFFTSEHGQLLRRDPRQLTMKAIEDDADAPRRAAGK